MATDKHKTISYLEKGLLKRLDRFWHRYGFRSRSSAIAWLLAWALSQNPVPPPQREDDEYYD